ncbi:UNVERIFIED_CONTAM: hypothetical protein GTU68_041021 [Idotea baltica]|nr:hypothetical protein [Idotea baltica]
MLFKKSLINS